FPSPRGMENSLQISSLFFENSIRDWTFRYASGQWNVGSIRGNPSASSSIVYSLSLFLRYASELLTRWLFPSASHARF
ncbi:hypothetical protein ACTNDP_23210, partial [Paenibacillus barengoltzii]|uniref:hypothetical protein n=1 Tax=Paenibacillus barengoltzii TaxID=343517 RepID=UPI003F8C6630